MNLTVSQYIKIENNKVFLNGVLYFKVPQDMDFPTFTKVLYKHAETKYLKFFKMDKLARLGFIAAEVLLNGQSLTEEYPSDKIGVVLSNSSSTIDIDTEYYNTIKDKDNYFPSPALFVYTLPNIMIGEICIRNKFNGENNLFVEKEFNPDFQIKYINGLFHQHRVQACLGGWVEYSTKGYEAFLYLVEIAKEAKIPFNKENILKLYK